MKSASVNVGNVQPHSAGDIFPYRIVVRINEPKAVAYCRAENSENGYVGPVHQYKLGDENSFKVAHRAAETDAVQHRWDVKCGSLLKVWTAGSDQRFREQAEATPPPPMTPFGV